MPRLFNRLKNFTFYTLLTICIINKCIAKMWIMWIESLCYPQKLTQNYWILLENVDNVDNFAEFFLMTNCRKMGNFRCVYSQKIRIYRVVIHPKIVQTNNFCPYILPRILFSKELITYYF